MLLLGTLLSLIVVAITARSILRPLNRAIVIAGCIAGGWCDFDIEVQSTDDGVGKLLNSLGHMQSSIRQAEERLQARKEEMQYLAFHDALTDLLNLAQFENEIERLLVLAD